MSERETNSRPGLSPGLLEGEHVLVTGGGTGLGKAMACELSRLGAAVSLMGRRRPVLEAAVAEIAEQGGRAHGVSVDLRDAEAVAAAMEEAESELGELTGLINNAAGNFLAATEGLSSRAFDAVVRTNLHGSFHCTQECGRRWIERKHPGAVLSILTTYAETGSAFVVPSAVSKAGVLAMTRSLAVEWGCHGIRLNAIAPGPIPTPGAWDRLVPDGGVEESLRARVPLGRLGTPDDIASLAAFLMSDLASWITGECVVVDGGDHLACGGTFNDFARLPREDLLQRFDSLRGAGRGHRRGRDD
ncbi:MAG: SDR family oxidoreductase [Acidobacteriota bacterium]